MATATSFNTTSLTSLNKTSQFHQKLSSLSSSTCQFRIISKPLSIVIKKASLNPRSELVSNGDDNNGGNSKRSSSIAALEQIKISPSNRYTKEKSSIIVLGLSYHTSPVEMREKLAIQDEELPRAIAELCGLNHIEEAGVLSTCNRMEIYVVALSWHRGVREVVDWMAKKSGIPASDLRRHLVLLRDGYATQHLFEVAAGLDSLVLGEGQILSQVRNVLKSGEQIPGFGRIIGGMFKHASKVGGRVRDEAKLAFGAVSMSSAAVELAIKKLPTGSSHIARVLLIGAGEMGEDVIKHLAGKKWTQVVVVNRSEERVSAIREKVKNIEIIYKPFTEIFACIAEADVVFTCTSADTFLFKENVDSLPPVSPAVGGSRLFIDISVPRNVSSCVSEVTYTQVYNGDDLKQVVDANKEKRRQKAMEAQPIIVEETKKFRDWRDSLETVPFIKRLRSHGEAIVKEELRKCFAKSGKNISEEAMKIIESMAFSIMNKMLHGPMVHLRCDEKDGRDLHETLENMYVLDRIYNLETEASVLEQKIRDKLNQMQGET